MKYKTSTAAIERIRHKHHKNYDNPKCVYCGGERSFFSGRSCSFCYRTRAKLKEMGFTVPQIVSAAYDFDAQAYRSLSALISRQEKLEAIIKEKAMQLAIRLFRKQHRKPHAELPVRAYDGWGDEVRQGTRVIAVDTRTPLDDLLEKEDEVCI